MFGDIPDNYKPQTAENEEEGFLYVLGEKYQGRDSRRPPELLTRDHVARCIVREVKEGRGSPHGGVFLELQTFAEWFGKREREVQGRGALEEEAAEHVPPVQGTRRASTSPSKRWRSARRRTTSWAASASMRHTDVAHPRPVRVRRMCRGHQRRESPRRQLALGPARARQAGRRVRREVRQGASDRRLDPQRSS